jgi:hypothetical protein
MGYTQSNASAAQKAAAHAAYTAAHVAWAAAPTRANATRADDAHKAACKAYGSFDMGPSGAAGGSYGGGSTGG